MCNEHGKITLRQRDILRLVYQGYTSLKIAEQLKISKGTVDVHVHQVLRKLQVTSRVQAAAIFVRCPMCQSTHPVNDAKV